MTIGGTGTMLYPVAGGLARQAARVAGSMLPQTAAPRSLCAAHRYVRALILHDSAAAITGAHDAAEQRCGHAAAASPRPARHDDAMRLRTASTARHRDAQLRPRHGLRFTFRANEPLASSGIGILDPLRAFQTYRPT